MKIRSKQSPVLLTYEGQTKPLLEWAKEKRISYRTVYFRLKECNYPIDRLFEPVLLSNEREMKRVMISDKNGNDIMIVASKKIAAQVTGTDDAGVWRQMKGLYRHRGGFKFRHIL